MKERVSRSVPSRRDSEQPSTLNNHKTRQERREQRVLRLKRNILKVLTSTAPVLAALVLILALTTPLPAQTIFETTAQKIADLVQTLGPIIGIIGVVLVGALFVFGDPHASKAALYVGVGLCFMLGASSIVIWLAGR
jgi:type IV secretory pathway VirB2 component (pilin)